MKVMLPFIFLSLTACYSWKKPEPEAIITPNECKRMCKPSSVESFDALEGTCSCNKRSTKRR